MKVNKIICSIAVLAIATFTSICNAQTEIAPAIDVHAFGGSTSKMGAQQGASHMIDQPAGSMVVGEQVLPAQPAFETTSEIVGSGYHSPAPVVQSCDCSQESCSQCRPKRRACGCKRRGCQGDCGVAPMFQSCEGDFCKLSIKKGKEKKTCFKTEQETICIPAVRLPWQDCCPPSRSRTRLVTRLKTHKEEVESCSYKWEVEETNDCGCGAPTNAMSAKAEQTQQTIEGSVVAEPVAEPLAKPKVSKEAFEESAVPPAPKVKGAFLKAFRQR